MAWGSRGWQGQLGQVATPGIRAGLEKQLRAGRWLWARVNSHAGPLFYLHWALDCLLCYDPWCTGAALGLLASTG